MAEDWDLFAIVRSCQSATATTENPPPTTTNTTPPSLATFTFKEEYNEAFSFPNIVQPITNEFHELNQLLTTSFNPTTTTTTTSANGINTNSPDFAGCIVGQQQSNHLSVLVPPSNTSINWSHLVPQASTSSFNRRQHVQKNQNQQLQVVQKQDFQVQVPQSSSALVSPNPQPQTPRARKRKSQQKKMVCQVTAENLSSDLWAWRKYGQKPIKGSPYPRNYYRCSSSKGCAARKQVERSNTEADMFIVTYTGDHSHPRPTHRNSLAGSTRNKSPPSSQTKIAASSNSSPPSSSAPTYPPVTASENPPGTDDPDPDPEIETDDDVDDEADILLPTDVAIPGDMFLGFDHFPGSGGGGQTGEYSPKTNPA